MVPRPHCDFLYATINVYVPAALVPNVLAISQSVYYDSLTRQLTARCNSINSVVAALRLAMMIVANPENANTLSTSYAEAAVMARDPMNYRQMFDELRAMVLRIRNYMPTSCQIRVVPILSIRI